MKKAVKIVVERWEGRITECGKEEVEGADVWSRANAILLRWSRTAPSEGGGCHKCGFTVTYEDGETYEGRYELTRKWPSIQNHMREHVMFSAGLVTNPWMGEERYRAYLNEIVGEEKMADYKKFLSEYEMGPQPKTPQVSYLEAMGVL